MPVSQHIQRYFLDQRKRREQWRKSSQNYYNYDENRHKKVKYEAHRYKPAGVAARKKQNVKNRYMIQEVAEIKQQKEKDRYANPEVSDKKKQNQRDRYANPEVADKKKQKVKDRNAIPEVADKKKQNEKDRYTIPEVADKKKQKVRNRYTKPEVADKKKQKEMDRYTIPEVAKKKKQNQKLRYGILKVAHSKLKKLKTRYHMDKLFRSRRIKSSKLYTASKKAQKSVNILQCIITFRKHCKQYPIYKCSVCGRLLFRSQVLQLKMDKYKDKQYDTAEKCVQKEENEKKKTWICTTCQRYFKTAKVPPQALINNMMLPAVSQDVQLLNVLEKHLVSPVIPFMKIVVLPKSSQKGIHDL